jgi:hypothetical protein
MSDAPKPEVISRIWRQTALPVVFRGPDPPLKVKLPYQEDNKVWLRGEERRRPKWNAAEKHWETPRNWFDRVLAKCLERYGAAYVVQYHRDKPDKCAPACWNAKGSECNCSCDGANHGKGAAAAGRWFVINDTLAVQWGDKRVRCWLVRPGKMIEVDEDTVVDAPANLARYLAR